MTYSFGTRVKCLQDGRIGVVVGFGSLQWPEHKESSVVITAGDRLPVPVYLVQVGHASNSITGPACAVWRADRVMIARHEEIGPLCRDKHEFGMVCILKPLHQGRHSDGATTWKEVTPPEPQCPNGFTMQQHIQTIGETRCMCSHFWPDCPHLQPGFGECVKKVGHRGPHANKEGREWL